MSFIRAIKCDKCCIRVQPKQNGEHWGPPDDWVSIYDTQINDFNGQHLCQKCKPHVPKQAQMNAPKRKKAAK